MNWILPILLAFSVAPVITNAPNRQPQLAARDHTVAMVFGSGHSVWFSRSDDNGIAFSTPVRIVDRPALALGRHRGPRITFSGNTMVLSAVVGSAAATELTVWRSEDSGKTWSKPVIVNDVPAATREGLHAMAVDSNGHLAAVWLDLRQKGTRLYGAFSNDAGATWSKNVLIYESPEGTICECCDPSITALGPGEFAVMWRNSIGGMRDFYLTRVRDGKPVEKARKLGTGSWKLAACPMDGGGLVFTGGKLTTAWRRENAVYLAEPEGKETQIGVGKDVAVASTAKGIYVAWASASGIEVRKPGSAAAMKISASGSFPALTALSDGAVLAAWEDNGAIVIKRVD